MVTTPDGSSGIRSPRVTGVQAPATVDIRVFTFHTFSQQVSIADPCGGGGPYGHHPVAIAFSGSIVAHLLRRRSGGCRHLDRILPAVKGTEIRSNATRGSARQRTHAIDFLDRILGLLRHNDVRVVARIWVKGIGSRFDATSVYTSSIQGICGYFEHYLTHSNASGVCIADSRNKFKNVNVSHSIFTQKFSPAARRYQPLVELPTFGHSENHAGLQICDIVCSALLYPIACFAYCTGHVNNVHVEPRAGRPQASLRTTTEGAPVPIPQSGDWPLQGRIRRLRRHRTPVRFLDVPLKRNQPAGAAASTQAKPSLALARRRRRGSPAMGVCCSWAPHPSPLSRGSGRSARTRGTTAFHGIEGVGPRSVPGATAGEARPRLPIRGIIRRY